MSKVDNILNAIIIFSCVFLIAMLLTLPKTDCEKCYFPETNQNGMEFFKSYQDRCLQHYNYGEENPNYQSPIFSSISPTSSSEN